MGETQRTTEPANQTQIQAKTVEIKTEAVAGAFALFKNGNFQLFLAVAGVAVTLFNIYLASKLAPVAQDIASVAQTVKAQNTRIDTLEGTSTLYLPRYIATEQSVTAINKSLDRIESAQIRLENKLDTVILQK